MPAANAIDLVDTWLISRLAGDSVLAALGNTGVYNSVAPLGVPYPFCVFACSSGKDTLTEAGVRTLSRQRYLVRCLIDQNDQTVLAQIATRVDLLLHGARSLPWAGGYIWSCLRQDVFPRTTQEAGVLYREIAQEYLVVVQGG
jgi:hypothetical protein